VIISISVKPLEGVLGPWQVLGGFPEEGTAFITNIPESPPSSCRFDNR
jgi:hypothetical protein